MCGGNTEEVWTEEKLTSEQEMGLGPVAPVDQESLKVIKWGPSFTRRLGSVQNDGVSTAPSLDGPNLRAPAHQVAIRAIRPPPGLEGGGGLPQPSEAGRHQINKLSSEGHAKGKTESLRGKHKEKLGNKQENAGLIFPRCPTCETLGIETELLDSSKQCSYCQSNETSRKQKQVTTKE